MLFTIREFDVGEDFSIFWSTRLRLFAPTCPADLTLFIHTVVFDRFVLWDMLSAPCTEPLAINLRNNLKIIPPHLIQTNHYRYIFQSAVRWWCHLVSVATIIRLHSNFQRAIKVYYRFEKKIWIYGSQPAFRPQLSQQYSSKHHKASRCYSPETIRFLNWTTKLRLIIMFNIAKHFPRWWSAKLIV